MAEIKSVTFSPILEQTSDEVSVGSSEIDLFPDGMKFEDAYIARLSKSTRKYQLPTEDERRVPRRRKIALLTLGFILLLGIGGVVIYLVTRELYNKEQQHYYSGAVSENRTGFASGNTSIKESTIRVGSFNTIKPSFESSKKQLSWHPVPATVHSPSEETTPVARMLTPTTVIQSSGLVTRFETKKRNATKSTFSTPNLVSPRKTTSHWLSRQYPTGLHTSSEPIRYTFESGERKTTTSYYLDHGTNSWNDDDLSEKRTSTESGFLTPVSSLNIIRPTWYLTESRANSSVLQKASSNTSSLSTKKKSTTGPFSTTLQDIGTLVTGVTSSESTNIWSSFSTAIRNSSEDDYSKSVGENTNFQITTKTSKRSKLVQTSSFAVTNAILRSPWGTSGTVNLTIGAIDLTASTLSPTTKSSLPSSLSNTQSDSTNVVNSFEGSLLGNTFSREWVSSQSISPVPYSNLVKNISSVMKSSFSEHNRSPWSIQVSPTCTPASGFIHESVLSSRKVHETSQSALLTELIYTASKLVTQEKPSKNSESLREDFSSVVMSTFPSSSLFTNQGSGAVEKILTPTKATSLAATQRSNPSIVVLRSTNQLLSQTEKHSLVTSTLPRYTHHNGFSTARDVTSLKTTTLLSSLLQTRPSISRPQIGIKVFSSAVMLNANSATKSSSLGPSLGEFNSLSVAPVSSYASVSSPPTYVYRPTFASEATTNGFSSSIPTLNIVSYSPSPNSKLALASRKMSTQQRNVRSSTDYVQHLNPNISTQTYQLTLHNDISDALTLSTVTRNPITTGLSSKQSTALPQSPPSIAKILSTDQLALSRMFSHSENARLSTVTSPREHRPSDNPYKTSQHKTWYTTTGISTVSRFSITTVFSNTRRISTSEPASRTMTSQVDNAGFSSNISTWRPKSTESLNVSLSSKKAHSVSTMELYRTFQLTLINGSSDTPTNSTVQSTIFSRNESSASSVTTLVSSNISLHAFNTTHSLYPLTVETVRIFPSPTYTSTTQVKPLKTTDSYFFSTVLTTFRPTSNSTAQFKIMDGSLVIRNGNFHANLSNANTTMFKALADEVEEIIMEIVSSDAKVTSFRNGSVIANFYLLVAYDSPFSDSDYAQLLSEANETLWRGYQVANITVTLRTYIRRPAARLQDGGGLSKAAVAAIFTVFSVLLIAVGCFGIYICKKKELCERSRVKPANSPIPPSELEKIQPVHRGTWVMNDEPFLKANVPKDPNYRSASFCETLNMRVLEENDTESDESCDPDLLRKSTRSPIEPEYANSKANSDSVTKNALPSASRSVSSTMMHIEDVNRPISGSSRNIYWNKASDSTHSEDDC